MVWYSHLFQNFPQFIVIHTVKGFGIVNKAEIDVFLELSCFFDDPEDVGNLISRSVGARYASGDQWEINLRKNERMEPKQKQYPVVDVTGDRSKVRCCKEQYCIGTWNVRFHESRPIGSDQTGDGKSEHQHFRNQQTKMDWNR